MDAITRDKLLKCGMNIEVTLDRFMGSEDLLIKFLKKFLADDNYQKLMDSVQLRILRKRSMHPIHLKEFQLTLVLIALT